LTEGVKRLTHPDPAALTLTLANTRSSDTQYG
jgi:hypothetical protein